MFSEYSWYNSSKFTPDQNISSNSIDDYLSFLKRANLLIIIAQHHMDAKIRRNITPFTKGSAWKKSPNIVKSGPLDITSVLTSEFIFKPHKF